ncbi:ATP-binding protein [Vibrio crassostreae]|uniref:ATP-binding protein n=1 Tax=Vibrio crassostreae TaxID=246167 RepID=UPI001B312469|nr:transporter substrate-binding domain-containing protein [Vibrio crassostreae]CAK3513370.1 two-component system, NarL family, sensor histidine kinase EvgS [Vibrio crassostreae]CAK3515765.1 two-component system, NarL family, sensor histidine kinase EvgS [Vibrio crassostreae]CAK3912769.1 two-component system, NarL family, sensor histidine kinase EvgS [Vibrio crassostreae]
MFTNLQPLYLLTLSLFATFVVQAAPSNDRKYTFAIIASNLQQTDSTLTSPNVINVDYLNNIAEALNLQFDLIIYKDIDTILTAIEEGNVDAGIGFSYTKERAARFLFSKPLFESTIVKWFRDPQLSLFPASSLQWACVENSVHCAHLSKLSPKSVVQFPNLPKAMDGVMEGKAQAIIGSFISITEYLNRNNITSGIMSISNNSKSEKLRLLTSKGNQHLVDKFNQVLSWEAQGLNVRSIVSRNPYHVLDELLIDFRARSGMTVSYSTGSDAYPFFKAKKGGEYEGFLIELFGLFASRSGLNFEYNIPEQSQGDLTGFKTDLVPVAYSNSNAPSLKDWSMSKPFLKTDYVSLERAHLIPSASNGNIGVLIGLEKQGVIHLESWREQSIRRFDDLSALRIALEKREIDIAYIPEDIVHSYIANGIDDQFELGKKNTLSISYSFAVSHSNPELLSVINALLDTIDMNEIQKLHRNYRKFNLSYGYSNIEMMLMFSSAMAIFVAVLVIVFIGRNNLKLKVSVAQSMVNQEVKEKHWLQEIIGQINSLVFIHDKANSIVLSNCVSLQNGDCINCTLSDAGTSHRLVDNVRELSQVFNGNSIADEYEISQCLLDVKHIKRERKIIYSDTNRASFVITVLQDVTDQKIREKSLNKAQQDATSAVAAREQFLATMSHELRTPIAGVHGLLDLLGHKVGEKPLLDLVEQAKHSISHLNQLVDEILDFSKIESGSLHNNPNNVDIIATVCKSVRAFEIRAQAKGLPLHLVFPPTLSHLVNIDATKVTQVISNLLSNAIKFTHQGLIKVDVNISETHLVFGVSDTGIGMSESQLDKVLEPFTQADNSISREYGGTGLGLTIVEKIVSALGGGLEIKSTLNVGTTVSISVPFTQCSTQNLSWSKAIVIENISHSMKLWCDLWEVPLLPLPSMSTLNEQNSSTLSDFENKYPDLLLKRLLSSQSHTELHKAETMTLSGKVLVAEDNPLNQAILKLQLTELGLDFVITSDGIEAKAQLNGPHLFDLLITDFHMPKMDGLTLVRELRKHPQHQALPVAALTADDPFIAAKKAEMNGIDLVITKPYTLETLYRKLSPLLTKDPTPEWLKAFDINERYSIGQLFVESVGSDLMILSSNPGALAIKKALHRLKGGLAAVSLEVIIPQVIKTEEEVGMSQQASLSELVKTLNREIEYTKSWINHHA